MKYNVITNDTNKPGTPHITVDYLKRFGNGDIFIETGTYLGDALNIAMDAGYLNIHSVELDKTLYENICNKFHENEKIICKNYTLICHGKSNIKLYQGDSIDCLDDILKDLTQPATFWLDAHASGPLPGGKSGGSPVIDELKLIKKHHIKDHTIFIDDRRLFGSSEWSYVKEEDAISLLKSINPKYNIYYLDGHIKNDIICGSTK